MPGKLGDFEVRPKISAILEEAAGKAKKESRVEILRKYDHPALRIFLAVALNPHVHWDLPEEDPPYTPNELEHDQEGTLYNEIRKLYLFLKPNHIYRESNPSLSQEKRQLLFIQLLEEVDRQDAKLLLAAKRKRLHVKLSPETVEMAFPGLISWKPE